MTEIEATLYGNYYAITARNHSNDSRVCTAISTLLQTLEGAIKNNDEATDLYIEMGYGKSTIEYIAEGDTAREDFRVILLGLLQLERAYPDSIRIKQNIFD